MYKTALLVATGAAALMATPAEARHHHRHYYRSYYSYSPYRSYSYAYPAYSYAYPAYSYSYPAYSYSYPAYYGYPSYYSYPSSSFGISIGLGGGYRHYRRW